MVDITGGGVATGMASISGISNMAYSLTGLSANNDYAFYVQADCGAGDTSTWVGPFAFSTPCEAVTSFPYTDGFENSGATPDCWSQEYVSATVDWAFTDTNGDGSVSPQTGNYMAVFSSDNYDSDASKLIMPALDLTSLADPTLQFSYTSVSWDGDYDDLRLYYKTSATDSWTLLQQYLGASGSNWTNVSLQLPNPSSDYYIAFEATSGYGYGITLDDVLIEEYATLSANSSGFNGFQYFPNPVNNTLSLRAQNTIDTVSIYNLLGQEVLNLAPNAMSKDIDISVLKSGNYFVRVNINGAMETIKILKE